MFSVEDHQYMARALQLAARGIYTTSPNPNVGCVLVAQGQIVGEGYHHRAGGPHAEVHALRMAGEKARGATAYVTLEPCSHFGRTPPCANALIDAGVRRVVAAMVDPNPQVAGRGLRRLAEAGIETASGLMQTEAEALNRGFLQRMRTGRPYVRVKLAASLDGKTALSNGESQWITSVAARADVQRWRAASSAILTGASTVVRDNPSLNVRWADLPASVQMDYPETELRQPVRVVIDSQYRISREARLFQLPGSVWLARTDKALPESDPLVHAPGVELLFTSADPLGKVQLPALLQQLASRNINDLWVEAGATLAGAMMQAGLVDELIVYLAPKLMGHDAQSLIRLPEFHHMADVLHWQWHDVRQVGDDLRLILRPCKES